ncbi:MAG: DUF501 domain-containing protein [Actinomycetota bacterium]|nr:DUF501 domain-containing protein [Actinomycetota bacterium]MDK1026885.1 DUF501 domain-containing protein [Actinomycetota bacterium]MDK1038162.1 DUF501 domain-containing protein [Actinomycetota bacterium]MDK1096688.1 DUF501 domain-containing protein [Actinomycetota bacterium]MDK1291502.1 DUF501 domain-containing protein [Actinomycetota bacterium]
MDDRSVVAIQIGREPRSEVNVRARCHLGLPVVIDVPPILDDGTPFPTTHWLTCPLAVLRISRVESAGGVREADALVASDRGTAEAFTSAMDRYRAYRETLLPAGWRGPAPSGGIGGSQGGVKCLHAQYADTAAGNENPIGADIANRIEPLDCTVVCVTTSPEGVTSNDDWVEPS